MAGHGWVKIAGRGKLGDQNWGANFTRPLEELQSELAELREHIGEVVMLTGGGSMDGVWLAVLQSASWTNLPVRDGKRGRTALKAGLTNVTPKISGGREFEPYIESWQISVLRR